MATRVRLFGSKRRRSADRYTDEREGRQGESEEAGGERGVRAGGGPAGPAAGHHTAAAERAATRARERR